MSSGAHGLLASMLTFTRILYRFSPADYILTSSSSPILTSSIVPVFASTWYDCDLMCGNRWRGKQAPYQVNMMMAGYDKDTGPVLYYLDYIATLHRLDKGALGFGETLLLN